MWPGLVPHRCYRIGVGGVRAPVIGPGGSGQCCPVNRWPLWEEQLLTVSTMDSLGVA